MSDNETRARMSGENYRHALRHDPSYEARGIHPLPSDLTADDLARVAAAARREAQRIHRERQGRA